ncbi:MAG: hypothetical protein IJS17_02915 [Clostridia bacterium]|nr:hypothetical protein [Clostridia bacterium]
MLKGKIKGNLVKYISIFLILFIALYFSYRAFSMNNSAYKTQTALLKTIEQGIDTTVFIVRDEEYLNKIDSEKTSVSLISDGERVADNEIISALFNSKEDAENYKKKLFYESELERYNSLLTQEKINISDILTYDSKTNDLFQKYVDSIRANSFSDARDYISEFCNKITSRQSAMGVDIDLDPIISDLNSKINSLKNIEPEFIMSQSTGYFVNGVDGYENVLEYDSIENVTTEMIEDALKTDKKSDSSYAGKIINHFNWYMVCSVTVKDVQNLNVGEYVDVRFINSASIEEKAEIVAINTENKDKVALVLKCNNVTTKVFPLRKEKVKIITDKIEGYSVSKDAIRTVDGKNGVYVLRGKIVNFRNVDILYTENDSVLVRTFEDKSRMIEEERAKAKEQKIEFVPSIDLNKYIRLYDEVILKGGDLSDGKIIQ